MNILAVYNSFKGNIYTLLISYQVFKGWQSLWPNLFSVNQVATWGTNPFPFTVDPYWQRRHNFSDRVACLPSVFIPFKLLLCSAGEKINTTFSKLIHFYLNKTLLFTLPCQTMIWYFIHIFSKLNWNWNVLLERYDL